MAEVANFDFTAYNTTEKMVDAFISFSSIDTDFAKDEVSGATMRFVSHHR